MKFKQLGLLTGLLMAANTATADENLWVYAKGTDTRPEGSFEFKLSDVIRIDKNEGDYVFHDIRPEIEYGITDRLTIGASLMFFDHDYEIVDEDLQPYYDTQGGEGGRFNETAFGGYEIMLKYNVLSPYKDFMGLSFALGFEHRDQYRLDGADIDQDSFVAEVLMQKDFMDDTLITVLNIKTEFERRKSPGVLEEEIALDVAAGIAYKIAPKWYVGLEFRSQSDYLNPQEFEEAGAEGYDDKGFNNDLDRSSFDMFDFQVGTRHQYGNYFGPTVHYAEQKWWVTAGALWQIDGGGSKFSYNEGGKNYDEHEKLQVGIFYGYNW
jgi:hypothetical protein